MSIQKVWVVEHGEYSGRFVTGVFSTEENAKAAAGDDGDVTEFTVDPGITEHRAGLSGFHVEMAKDGTVRVVKECGYLTCGQVFKLDAASPRQGYPAPPELRIYDQVFALVWAKDAQHAIKITNEQRAQMIATGEWQRQEDEVIKGMTARRSSE